MFHDAWKNDQQSFAETAILQKLALNPNGIIMYGMRHVQIAIIEFLSLFRRLDQENRLVKRAELIPRHRNEKKYAGLFESRTGNAAKQHGWLLVH